MTNEQLENYRALLPGATDKQLEAMHRLIEEITDAWQMIYSAALEVVKGFVNCITPVTHSLAAYLTELDQARLEECPNGRVVHLAKHAKKARTRKKNLHRAMRIIEKEARP